MSVIAAKKYKDRIEIAADSQVTSGYFKDTKGDFSKLVQIDNITIGFSGTCEEGSLLYIFAKTHTIEAPTEKDVLNFFVEFSWWKKEKTGNYGIDNAYIVIVNDKLFKVSGLFVCEIEDYCSVGCGRDFALAALYLGHTPREAVKTACDIACFVGEPVIEYVVPIKRET